MKNSKKWIVILVALAICALVVALVVKFATQNSGRVSTLDVTPSITGTPTVTITPEPKPIQEYTSVNAKLQLKFKVPMYVAEILPSEDYVPGAIDITKSSDGDTNSGGLTISYRSPEIEGKGGVCPPEENGGKGWTKVKLFDQTIQLCESNNSSFGGYLMNKSGKVEYSFYITGSSKEDYAFYKDIILNGMTLK